MVNMKKFKIGDMVLIHNPETFQNVVRNKIAKIVYMDSNPEYEESKGYHPYRVKFLRNCEEIRNWMSIYNSKEIRKLSEEEQLAWSI